MSEFDDNPQQPLNFFQSFSDMIAKASKTVENKELRSHETIIRNKATYIRALRQHHHLFTKKYKFESGDLVKWKPHMMVCRTPFIDTPAIVIEVLDKPIISEFEQNPHQWGFRQKLDIILSVYMKLETNPFVQYHYDSRFFMPFDEVIPEEEICAINELNELMNKSTVTSG